MCIEGGVDVNKTSQRLLRNPMHELICTQFFNLLAPIPNSPADCPRHFLLFLYDLSETLSDPLICFL